MMPVSEKLSENVHSIATLGKTKGAPVAWDEKVMIGLDPRFTDEKPAAPYEFLVTVDPNIEILAGLISRKSNVHAIDNTASLCG